MSDESYYILPSQPSIKVLNTGKQGQEAMCISANYQDVTKINPVMTLPPLLNSENFPSFSSFFADFGCFVLYLFNILLTQPWLTLSCLEMTQGRIPAAAISIIFNLTTESFISFST